MREYTPLKQRIGDAALARNDALTLAAVALQVEMIATRLETGRELWVGPRAG